MDTWLNRAFTRVPKTSEYIKYLVRSAAVNPTVRNFYQRVFCLFRSCTLKFVVLDYDKFSRSEFVAEVMLSLLEVDLVEGTTLSRHLNSKTITDVSTISRHAVIFIGHA